MDLKSANNELRHNELRPDELVFYKNDGKFMSGGYGINSMFLNDDVSLMKTFNSLESGSKSVSIKDQYGGKKFSSIFENLAVPAGLFFMNNKQSSLNSVNNYTNHSMLPDNIFDEFMNFIEVDNKKGDNKNKKSGKKTTKKHTIILNTSNKKTRKSLKNK